MSKEAVNFIGDPEQPGNASDLKAINWPFSLLGLITSGDGHVYARYYVLLPLPLPLPLRSLTE